VIGACIVIMVLGEWWCSRERFGFWACSAVRTGYAALILFAVRFAAGDGYDLITASGMVLMSLFLGPFLTGSLQWRLKSIYLWPPGPEG